LSRKNFCHIWFVTRQLTYVEKRIQISNIKSNLYVVFETLFLPFDS
jgi:hypothetical protein